MTQDAFQDLIPDNLCFGCGPSNELGLRIKSYWDGDEAVCRYHPKPHQAAGPAGFLNGGIIATLIDCHAVCTAIAWSYKVESRPIGSAPLIWCVTGRLDLRFLSPTPIDQPVQVRAKVQEVKPPKTILLCTLSSAGEVRAQAEVVAVRVPEEWRAGG